MIKIIKRAFRSYNGRHFLSRWARKLIERSSIQKQAGYILASGFLVVTLVDPAVTSVSAIQAVENVENPPVAPEALEPLVKTETTLAWPVKSPIITQGYRFGHLGIDIQDDVDKNIYPADEGWVSEVHNWNYGYGKHVIIQHPHGRSSLYAHFASISVEKGQVVNRDTVLGQMGATGWASGVHLHFEVFQDRIALNPFDVLPDNVNTTWRSYTAESDVFHTASESAVVTTNNLEE